MQSRFFSFIRIFRRLTYTCIYFARIRISINLFYCYYFSGCNDNFTSETEGSTSLPDCLLTNVNPSRRSCDDEEMVVPTSNESKQSKRLFCTFCKKTVSKLGRHLMGVHKKEPEVARVINFPTGIITIYYLRRPIFPN